MKNFLFGAIIIGCMVFTASDSHAAGVFSKLREESAYKASKKAGEKLEKAIERKAKGEKISQKQIDKLRRKATIADRKYRAASGRAHLDKPAPKGSVKGPGWMPTAHDPGYSHPKEAKGPYLRPTPPPRRK